MTDIFIPQMFFLWSAVFFAPELWFVPILYQAISLLSYSPFLFASNPQSVIPAALLINTLVLGLLLWKQWTLVDEKVI